MAAWITPSVDIKLEIAFSTDPLATTPTYTDVTNYLRSVNGISRGTSSEDTAIGPGFATFVLSNRDRRFDPDYSSSPYSPNVKPMRRVRLTVTKTSAVVVFTGFVMSWQNDWTIDDGVSVIRCVDSMWWLANRTLADSAYVTEVLADSPSAYFPLQETSLPLVDAIGGITLGSTYNNELLAVDMQYPLGQPFGLSVASDSTSTAFFASTEVVAAPHAVEVWADVGTVENSWTITAVNNSTNYLTLRGATGSNDVSVQYSNSTDNRSTNSTFPGIDISGGPRHVVAYCDTTNAYLYVDGRLVGTAALTVGTSATSSTTVSVTINNDAFILSGSSVPPILSHFAIYTTAPSSSRWNFHHVAGRVAYDRSYGEKSGARISRVLDEIGWSSSLRAIDTGHTMQGPYLPSGATGIDYVASVVNGERGLFFCSRTGSLTFLDRESMVTGQATGKVFSDDGGAGAIKYTQLTMSPASVDTIRNVVTVSYSDVGAITRRDSTSETAYGSSRLFIDGPTISKAREASALASWELSARKDPTTRVESITIPWRMTSSTDTTNHVDTCSAVELGDVVTVEITPRNVGTQVVKTCQVLGIEHEISPEQGYTTLYLRPAYTQTGWFTIGTSALGGTDILLP